MRTMKFTLTGVTNLLMHADDVLAADDLSAWRKAPENKRRGTAGDDRSPAWTWITYTYRDDSGTLVLPAANIMVALRKAGGQMTLKGKTTFKSLSQSGLLIEQEFCELKVSGRHINISSIAANVSAPFAKHVEFAKSNGFKLDVRRAAVGTAKHVRVRPRFSDWEVSGTIRITSPDITEANVVQLFKLAGSIAGIGDWRPCSPKSPGSFGIFTSKVA